MSQPWSDKISLFLNKKSVLIPNGYSTIENIATFNNIKEKITNRINEHDKALYISITKRTKKTWKNKFKKIQFDTKLL